MPAKPGTTQIGFVGLGIMGAPMAGIQMAPTMAKPFCRIMWSEALEGISQEPEAVPGARQG